MKKIFCTYLFFGASAIATQAASISFTSLDRMTTNGSAFNVSVFDGKASYQPNADTGSTSIVMLGDGTLLDWKLLGGSSLNNVPFNSNNVGYSNGPAAYINNPTSFQVNGANIGDSGVIYTPQSWGNVWTTTDPGASFSTTADLTSFTVLNAGAVSNPQGPISGTVSIGDLTSGQFYFLAGGYQANTDYTVTLSGPGQTPMAATHKDVINANNNRVNSVLFEFTNPDGLYDTLTYTYQHNSGSIRGRFMGVALDGELAAAPIPEPSVAGLFFLASGALLLRRRK